MTKDEKEGYNFLAFNVFVVIASTLTFVIFKVTGLADISWTAALAPLWMSIVIAFSAAIAIFALEKMTDESKSANDDLQELK